MEESPRRRSLTRRARIRLTIRTKLLLGFSVPLIVAVAVAAFAYRTALNDQAATDWVEHTNNVIRHIGMATMALDDMELSYTAYLRTGSTLSRSSYTVDYRTLQGQLTTLGSLTSDNPTQLHRWDSPRARSGASQSHAGCGDRDRILQTLTNLLSNAIKFSERGSTVKVQVKRQNGSALFCVSDHGRGIPSDKLEVIFDRFEQVDASDARQKGGGTGLGLAIARSIVQQHGGEIWAEGKLGEGSAFYFTVPAAPAYSASMTCACATPSSAGGRSRPARTLSAK